MAVRAAREAELLIAMTPRWLSVRSGWHFQRSSAVRSGFRGTVGLAGSEHRLARIEDEGGDLGHEGSVRASPRRKALSGEPGLSF